MITNNKLILTTLTFIFLSIATTSFAQFFKPASIRTIEGEILTGYIKDNSFQKLSESVTFKTTKNSKEAINYTPDMLAAFAFADGDEFRSFDIAYDQSTDGETIKGKRFLHLLKSGTVNLYELRNKTESPLFIYKEGGAIQLLGRGQDQEALYIDVLKEVFGGANIEVPSDLPLDAVAITDLMSQYESGEIIEEIYKPNVTLWATASMPYQYWKDGYTGFSKGIYFESGMPIKRGMVSGLLGMEFYEGNRSIDGRVDDPKSERAFMYAVTLRGQYTFATEKLVSPYVAIGTVVEKTITNEIKLHTAVGANLNLGRHRVKLELADPTSPSVRVGYGFSLVK